MTISIAGAATAILVGIAHNPPVTFLMTSSATKTWTNMVAGAPRLTTARSGSHTPLLSAGRPIAMATGFGFLPGDGLGLTTHPGASLRSITAAGLSLAECGAG